MKNLLRAPFTAAVLLVVSACEVGPAGIPPVDPATFSAPAPIATPAPEVSGASQPAGQNYGSVSQYLGASDAKPDGRGLTDTRNLKPGQCGKGCVPTPGKRPLDASRDRLINDTVQTVKGGGSTTIRILGTVDNQQKNIKAADSKKLAANRAADTAQTVAKELRESGVNARAVPAGQESARGCGVNGLVCVVHQAHPLVTAECRPPAQGGCQLNLGRRAIASAVHQNSLTIPITGRPDDSGGGGGGGGGNGVTGGGATSGPNPGSGVFGSSPSGSGSIATNGSTTPAGGDAPVFDDSYFDLYPEDRIDLDKLSVRITVDVPRTFRVGGTLNEQQIRIVDVAFYCDGAPCTSPGSPTVESLDGDLSLGSSSTSYRRCPTPRSTGCEYYLADGSATAVGFNGSSPTGGRIVAGFLSPTSTNVNVRPTLTVDGLDVTVYEPTWVGGDVCDTDPAPRSCWDWAASGSLDMSESVSVVSTIGEVFTRSGNEFRLARPVYGTTGSR